MLGRIIESLSGQRYAEFLKENVFDPLGMHDSGYDSRNEVIKHRACGYDTRDGAIINSDYMDVSIVFAAGALYSTTEILTVTQLWQSLRVATKTPDEQSTPLHDSFWITPQTDTKFFSRERPDVQIEFFKNDEGAVSDLVLVQDQKRKKATRIAS